MSHHRFKSIVDKVQVTIYVDEKDVLAIQEEARKAYKERDHRLEILLMRQLIHLFCLLCQSFAPSHVCVKP